MSVTASEACQLLQVEIAVQLQTKPLSASKFTLGSMDGRMNAYLGI